MEITQGKLIINNKLYLEADNVLSVLQESFENVKDEYYDEAINILEVGIDSILEEVEDIDGENY